MALLVDRPVPEAIRNPVAIKLLVSGLFACMCYVLCTPVVLHLDRFCIYIFLVPC